MVIFGRALGREMYGWTGRTGGTTTIWRVGHLDSRTIVYKMDRWNGSESSSEEETHGEVDRCTDGEVDACTDAEIGWTANN